MLEPIADTTAIPPGQAAFVRHRDKELAVCHVTGPDGFIVCDNACPHASGNLSAGPIHRHTVVCPVHQWKFDLDSGYCVGTCDVIVKRYESVVKAGQVWVDVDAVLTPPPPPDVGF